MAGIVGCNAMGANGGGALWQRSVELCLRNC